MSNTTQNVNQLTINEILELKKQFEDSVASLKELGINVESVQLKKATVETTESDEHWEIGKAYLIRTVTVYATGILERVTSKDLVFSQAAWIPQTGRFADAVKSGDFSECEPFPGDRLLIVNRGAYVDAVQVPKVMTNQK